MQDMSLPPNEIQARLQRQWSWNVLESSLRNEVPFLF
jgi:hypothetical protein